MHQNRASPFASDFHRRRGYRREFRSEDHFYPFSSQKKSRFTSGLLRRGNRTSWGLKKSRDYWGSGKNRRRSRRESRDFGALRFPPINNQADGKGGLSLRGVAFMTVLAVLTVLAGLENTLPSFCWSYKKNRTKRQPWRFWRFWS